MVRTVGSDGARTEEAIATAAFALIAAYGYEAMTMRDLATRVGIQPGSLYRYYRSKHDLLEALMVRHLNDLIAGWRVVAPTGHDGPVAGLRAFVAFHIGYHARRQNEVFLANMELRSLQPDAHARVVRLRQDYEDVLTAILEEGINAGVFRPVDPRITTYAIIAMLTGLTTWYQEDGRLSRDEIAETYLTLILTGLVA